MCASSKKHRGKKCLKDLYKTDIIERDNRCGNNFNDILLWRSVIMLIKRAAPDNHLENLNARQLIVIDSFVIIYTAIHIS